MPGLKRGNTRSEGVGGHVTNEIVYGECFEILRNTLFALNELDRERDLDEDEIPEELQHKMLSQLQDAWRGLSTVLLQELSLGRSVGMAPLGTFYPLPPNGGLEDGDRIGFHYSEKFVRDASAADDSSAVGRSNGPISRLKLEKIGDVIGWNKGMAEQVVSTIIHVAAKKLASASTGDLDLPGLGTFQRRDQRLSFKLHAGRGSERQPPGAGRRGVTAASGFFGKGTSPLRTSMSGTTLAPLHALAPEPTALVAEDAWLQSPARVNSGSKLNKVMSAPQLRSSSKRASSKDRAVAVIAPVIALLPASLRPSQGGRRLQSESKAHFSPSSGNPGYPADAFTRTLPLGDQLYPPLIDRCSRTRMSLFREEVGQDLVSNVVASNYSERGACLTLDPSANDDGNLLRWKQVRKAPGAKGGGNDGRAVDVRNVDWAREHPAILDESPLAEELESAGLDRNEFCRVLSRYAHYASKGIPSDMLAPYNKQWLDHATVLLSLDHAAKWFDISEDRVDSIVAETRGEILKGYIRAAKVAVVNYALLNGRTRERLDIAFIPSPLPVWGSVPFVVPDVGTFGGPPDEWRAGLGQSRADLLKRCVQNSATALRLNEFWLDECGHVRLLAMPRKHREPQDIHEFHAMQVAQLETSVRQISESWETVIRIVSEESVYLNPAAGIGSTASGATGKKWRQGEGSDAVVGPPAGEMESLFFEAVVSQLSRLAREVVEHTLNEYVEFFERFEKEPMHYNGVKALAALDTWQDEFLINKLVVGKRAEQHGVFFKHDLEQVSARLLSPYKECVAGLRELARPDARLRELTSPRALLWEVKEDEQHIFENCKKIEAIIRLNLRNAELAIELYDPFVFLLDEDERVDVFTQNKSKERQDYMDYIQKLHDTVDELNRVCPPQIRMQMMRIDAFDANQKLIQCAKDCIFKLLKHVALNNQDRSAKLVRQFEQLNARLFRQPTNEAQLVQLEKDLESAETVELPALLADYEDVKQWIFLTWDLDHPLGIPDYESIWAVSKWKGYHMQITERDTDGKEDRAKIEGKLVERRNKFQDDIVRELNKVGKFKENGSVRMLETYLETLSDIKKKLEEFAHTMIDINEKEVSIGWEATDFEQLAEANTLIEPYDKLWGLVSDHQKARTRWLKSPLFAKPCDIDPNAVEAEVQTMWRMSFKLKAMFEQDNLSKPATVAASIKKQLDEFKENVPLLHALCNPGLRERHWKEISNVVGFEVRPEPSHNLQKFLEDLQLDQYTEPIGEISDTAGKEYQIENGLNLQISEWEPVKMETKDWSSTGTYIVAGTAIDEVQTLLDDHVIKTQTMKGSPYAAQFADRLQEWEEFLKGVQDAIDVWLKVQSVWLYLEPIFSSDDIMQQMPVEGSLFREVDADWRKIMSHTKADPDALKVFKQDGFMETLTAANNKLETVQKGLNDYLETKRLYFPRFFFLSNDNLLEILSETKDPRRVNAHIKKCFEGIQSLQFNDACNITHMISPEKEPVPMTTPVDPVAARGAVEVWLVQLEDAMIETVRDQAFKARDDYAGSSFVDWVCRWPGQVIIGIMNLYWTHEVTTALEDGGNQGLVDYGEIMKVKLKDIVALVRTEVAALVRCTLESLIVIFVHNCDTVNELRDKGTFSPKDFDWLVQLRYFIEENPDKPGQEDMFVRITNSFLGYAYEYIGNCGRLVVTPLTDRCYRTCCGALHLLYGAAPEGPAGTGKTETVKDLAKALARFCVVFNCSDELDTFAMAKFFKGLASSGGWACFDEFNRIDPEVLSVVAQQVLQIQNAVKARLRIFEFEGTTLPIKWTCNSFITMNPGYAGRAELPDNLKALYRTVAMMVPDYGLIAEIKLYSYGYEDARSLSGKIVTTYKLCSEQLSSQKHYDYGMRAVFSVLVAAGNGKRKYPEESESILMLRAISDVNLAKFLNFDVPLFKGITSDLFPGVVLPKPDFGALIGMLEHHLSKQCCQPHPYFIEKIIQFYECHIVRHSVMLVGLPFSGKTTALKCLQDSLSDLAREGTMHPGCIVHQERLNPKSIPPNCLYGSFDDVSHEWADGIVAVLFRNMGRNQTDERKWLLFDGPIDAVWIENMNTVMDENKKLCLNSGEIIAMSSNMRTIMEPQDVAEASPATISRNGMVYFEPHLMGYSHLLEKCWGRELPEAAPTLDEAERAEVVSMVNWLLPPLIEFAREQCQEVSPTQDQNLVQSFLLLLCTHLKKYLKLLPYKKLEEGAGDPAPIKKNIIMMIDATVAFCGIWAIGAVLVTASRPLFSTFFRSLLKNQAEGVTAFKKFHPDFPERGGAFDHVFAADKLQWTSWNDTVDPQVIPNGSAVESIIVQTLDNIRYKYILEHCVENRIKLLFCGPTGTGKTAYMQQVLMNLEKDSYMQIILGFSAQTKCAQTQDLIDAKLDRRRKGVYGPPLGKVACVMVDDLNMPNKETYGAQPPIEILRQMIDANAYPQTGGWYDRKDSTHPFRSLIDVLLFAAMGPPGGGRSFIAPRMLGHLYLVGFPLLDDENMANIFNTVLEWKFASDSYPDDVASMCKKIVAGTMTMYKSALAELLPTPLKVHYTFNLRDFAKVIFGMLLMKKQECDGPQRHVRLWIHEISRVFGDRLVNEPDRMWLLGQLRDLTKTNFAQGFDDVMKHCDTDGDGKVQTLEEARRLIFGDMLCQPAAPNRPYGECLDLANLQSVVESHLDQYNLMSTKKMDLVCFLYMLEHLSRVARIIKTPGGNALLVGVGGSGRQSCARLACFLADFTVYQIEIARGYDQIAFREDLKKMLTIAGGKGENTVFLFTDSQIKSEGFVEDLNNLLNAGEVPNLFPAEERVALCEMVRSAARSEGKAPEGTPVQLYGYFVERCRKKLAVVLCFSPIGDAWRTRIRQFPSLVNCCTIDWFTEWPADALTAVAEKFLGTVEMDDKVRASCVVMCSAFHGDTRDLAVEFKEKLKRIYYATPTSFLELIQTFKQLLAAKRKSVTDLKDKYEKGLEKILTTESSVAGMKIELINLQPKLVAKNTEVEAMMVIVNQETESALKVKTAVAADEAVAADAAATSDRQKAEVEGDLAIAMPALEEALGALDTLSSKDIGEIKAMKDPPGPVKLVLSAVCIIKGLKPERKKDEAGKTIEDFWSVSLKMVAESDFLKSLQTFDKDNIPAAIVKKIGTFTVLDDFQPDRVKRVSLAAWGIAMWVRAMETYDKTAKVVGPKKEALAVAVAEYEKVMVTLNEKRAELQKVVDALAELENKLAGLNREKGDLAYQVDLCQKKLMRAEMLIESLGGEKARWGQNSKDLAVNYVNLTGDVIVASGLIAYLGAFTPEFRESAVTSWGIQSKGRAIPGSEAFSLDSCLGEPVKIRGWTIAGLPNDSFSIENGIIIDKSRRWPLCIDPQVQANKWIKKMEQPNKIRINKFTDGDYIRKLEGAITFGNPVLIENILEDTDPAIEPVLLKQTFKKGNALMLKLGDSLLEYNKDFRFYLTTKLRNPHYLPEVAVKVTLLNFMITMVGLQDQLLNFVVQKERPELAEEKSRLVVEGAESKAALEDTENKILHVLQTSQGNILDDESAINVLSSSKVLANQIAAKQEVAEEMEKQIDEARQCYVPVAFKGAILFFVIADLANIDPMYQYSLPFFVGLYLGAIDKAEPSEDLDQRIENLNDTFRFTLYCNICRSLFEKHKTLFSLLLCIRVLLNTGGAEMSDYRFLLTGGVSLDDPPPKPEAWVPDRCWGELFRLSKIHERYTDFHLKFAASLPLWKRVYDDAQPMRILKDPATRPSMMAELDSFHDVLVLRCIRPDRIVPAVLDFICEKIGEKFVTPPPFDLQGSYSDSSNLSPLVFILSPGADPGSSLFKFAEERGKEVAGISLGQGQGPKAEKLMSIAAENGSWVLLQNCHLATSWMPKLERMLEEQDPKKIHREFRLWLTSYPSNKFPVSILQNGVKMTNEAPKGLRANMTGSYMMNPISTLDFFDGCTVDKSFKTFCFNLCFFHAVIQERRLFGPLGWNIAYEFTENDLRISVRQLQMFLDDYPDEAPIKALNYLTGECNYGGRVTEGMDRRLIITLLSHYYSNDALDKNFAFFKGDDFTYTPPPPTEKEIGYEAHLDHIRSLPLVTPPGVFGFHENANLTKEMGETYNMCSELLLTMGAGGSGGGQTPDDVVGNIAKDVLERLPQTWDIVKVQKVYPTMYTESMNTVLAQEITRFNVLIDTIRGSFNDIKKAVKGLLLMSAALEVAFYEVFDGKTPGMWLKNSYPSLKPMGGYVNDLLERLKFFANWVDHGTPINFWFSGIYFQQAFTTGTSQNYARTYQIPIDTLSFNFAYPKKQEATEKPKDGVLCHGIFFEACRWDWDNWEIAESAPKVLFAAVPTLHLVPCKKDDVNQFACYECPCYKVSTRKGILSTTGHSTNFVMSIKVPSSIASDHWVKRGSAMLTSLDT